MHPYHCNIQATLCKNFRSKKAQKKGFFAKNFFLPNPLGPAEVVLDLGFGGVVVHKSPVYAYFWPNFGSTSAGS